MVEDTVPSGPRFERFRREYDSLSSEPPKEPKPSRQKPFFQRLEQIETSYRPESTFDDLSVLLASDQESLRNMVGEPIFKNYVEELRSIRRFQISDAFMNILVRMPEELTIDDEPLAKRRFVPKTENQIPIGEIPPLSNHQRALLQRRRDLLIEDESLRSERNVIQTQTLKELEKTFREEKGVLDADLRTLSSDLNKARGRIEGRKSSVFRAYRKEHDFKKDGALPPGVEEELMAQAVIPQELQEEVARAQAAFDERAALLQGREDRFKEDWTSLLRRSDEIDAHIRDIKKMLNSLFDEMYKVGLISRNEHENWQLSVAHKEARQEEKESRKYLGELEDRLRKAEKSVDPSNPSSVREVERLRRLCDDARASQRSHERAIARLDEKLYEAGMIPFSELRVRMIGDNLAAISATETLFSAVGEAWKEDGRNRDDTFSSYKSLYEQAIGVRMRDLMLTAPGESAGEIKKYVAEVMKKAGTVLGDILSDKVIDNINEKGKEQLIHEVLNAIIYPHYRLEIIVGFGGSEDDLNIRLPSYIIPALHAIRSFLKAGVKPPTLRIVNAQALAVEINGKDEDITRRNAFDTNTLLVAFVERFYPDCRQYIECFIPTLEESLGGTYYGDVAHLGRFVPPADEQLNNPLERAKLSDLDVALGELARRDRIHGEGNGKKQEAENYIAYAAAHAYLFGNIQHIRRKNPPNGVIKFGGSGEHYFNIIQQYLADKHRVESIASQFYLTNTAARGKESVEDRETGAKTIRWKGSRPIFVTQTVGGNPPYYRAGKTGVHEITIDEIVHGDKRDMNIEEAIAYYNEDELYPVRDARHDVELLEKEIGDEYFIFLKEYEVNKNKQPHA